MIYLRKTSGEFAAAGTRCGDDHQGFGGDDIGVGTVALVADDVIHVRRVARDGTVDVIRDAAGFQLVGKGIRRGLPRILRDDHAVDGDAEFCENVDLTEQVHLVADAEVCTHFRFLDITGTDTENDLDLIAHFAQ